MDLTLRTESWGTDDQSWLGSRHGIGECASVTLDTSLFTSGTHYPDGFFKSGIALGKITATGKYGPYAGRANEAQTINLGAASAGTITIGLDGETTAAIAFNANAAAVQAALELLSNVNPGDVTVTGGPLPGTITLTFGGRYVGVNIPTVVVTPTGLTGGTVTVATTTAGGSTASDGRERLAGFLFSPVPAPTDTAIDPVGAMLDHGKVVNAKLPVPVDAAGQADVAGRIIFY
jgi:hypothetical protein